MLLEDVQITDGSPLVGLTVGKARRSYMPDVNVLAVKTRDGVILNPDAGVALDKGDALAVIGTATQLAALEQATAR